MRGVVFVLAAALGWAQSGTITATVVELPDANPVAGAQVQLTGYDDSGGERRPVVLATLYTGNTGEVEFRGIKLGDYTVEASKPGYYWGEVGGRSMTETGGLNVRVTAGQATPRVVLTMLRPGTISGRVEDENGNPIAGLELGIGRAVSPIFQDRLVTTDADGRFLADMLIPDRYLVRISPALWHNVAAEFTEEDAAKIDENIETSYWPGGAALPSGALPIVLSPGGVVDLGTIRPRKTNYHRVRIRALDAGCPGESRLTIVRRGPGSVSRTDQMATMPLQLHVPCREEFLLTGLQAGSYTVLLATGQPAARWAMAEIDLNRENRTVEMHLSPAIDILGRVTPGEGVTVPDDLQARVSGAAAAPLNMLPGTLADWQDSKSFVLPNVLGVPLRVQFSALPRGLYAIEMRYAGRAVQDGVIYPVPGAELEIVLDDKPATLTGTVTGVDRDGFALVALDGLELPGGQVDSNGRFQIPNIPPGEYRVFVIHESSRFSPFTSGDPANLDRARANAETITLKRGETKDVTLRAR